MFNLDSIPLSCVCLYWLKIFLGLFCLLLLQRFIKQMQQYWYYAKQGVQFCKGWVPLLGHLPRGFKILKTMEDPFEYPGMLLIESDFGQKQPKVISCFLNYFPYLFFRDPEMLNELYVTKNKYFDKHPLHKNLLYPLMGDSILLAASTHSWSQKRKTLSQAFYKDKLILMCDLVKGCLRETIDHWKRTYIATPGKQMDMIAEISKLFIKIFLTCAFGEDLSDYQIQYVEGWKTSKRPLGYALRDVFHRCIYRLHTMQMCIFPETVHWYITPWDRNNRSNIYKLRAVFQEVVQKRRKLMQEDPNYSDRGDLLHILLTDDLFKNDDKMIVDECLTFFFAASQTSSMSFQNMLLHIMQQPQIIDKIRAELKQQIIDPAKQSQSGEKDIEQMMDFENIFNLQYYTNCFLESLRIEPPVMFSSYCTVTEDTTIGGITVKKGDPFTMDMYFLHHNAEEWIDHEKFIPERFDSASPYALTPSGKKRHPMSFAPFLGGKRICLGKTFVETISKIIGPTIIGTFDFKFVDQKHYSKKPANNMMSLHEPSIFVNLSLASC